MHLPSHSGLAKSPSPPSAAAQLKHMTAALHRQLDQHALVKNLLRQPIDNTHYDALMRAFSRAYHHIEPALLEYEQTLRPMQRYQSRRPVLETISPSPAATRLIEDAASYWGCRYVLDGSSHGANILLPRLSTQLSQQQTSLRYWHLLAEQSAHWPWLCRQLESCAPEHGLDARCIAAARATYQIFIDALELEAQHARRPLREL
ncbi:MAG: biliverdin-producing heme oxygenase [Oleiphilaceae bacterium]|nr:biliverdin-producing heme oxygenase [Oleiphilaceae bacterium]